MVVVVGIDPTSSPYEGGTHPSTSHNRKIGVSYRYRSGTTAFTEQGAGHYTKDTISVKIVLLYYKTLEMSLKNFHFSLNLIVL